PKPYLLEENPSFTGGAFILLEVIPDSTSGGKPMPEDRALGPCSTGPHFGVELATQLARLHILTHNGLAAQDESDRLHDVVTRAHRQWLEREQPRNSLVTD